MGASSRREAIYKCPSFNPLDILEKVGKMMRWARANNGAGFAATLNWYMNRDIGDFDPYAPAPKTHYKDIAIALSKTPMESFASELTDWTMAQLDGVAAFTATQLAVLSERWGHDIRPKVQYIKKALQSYGDLDPQRVIKVDNKPQRHVLFVVTKSGHKILLLNDFTTIAKQTSDAIKREIEQN
jgi:hypothetical protein